MKTVAEYNELAQKKFPNIDISLLVLNAGIMQPSLPYDMTTDDEAESVFCINGLHVVYMAKSLVNRLLKR